MQHNVIRLVPRQTDEPTDRAVYTVPEVARLLSLSRGSAYACVRDGTIPAIRVGGRWMIPKRRFHTWLDGLTENGDN
ncbi:helix-turn-helix domain-containing protein [Nonomuraea muscovyensis]